MIPVQRSAEPGHLIRFVSSKGTELEVSGLTVRHNRTSTNAVTVKDWWARKTPSRLSTFVLRPQFGDGQAEARYNGRLAASVFTGKWLDAPTLRIPGRVKGTSSGLAWSLATIANNDPYFLTGRKIAATGLIEPSGDVLEIAGLRQKLMTPEIAEYDIVLVPASQLEYAYKYTRSWRENPSAPMIFGVRNLAEAVMLLCLQNMNSSTCRSVLSDKVHDQRMKLSNEAQRTVGSRPVVVLHALNANACSDFPRRRSWSSSLSCRFDNVGTQVAVFSRTSS